MLSHCFLFSRCQLLQFWVVQCLCFPGHISQFVFLSLGTPSPGDGVYAVVDRFMPMLAMPPNSVMGDCVDRDDGAQQLFLGGHIAFGEHRRMPAASGPATQLQ